MAEVGGKMTVIAHVACNNTADSRELAAHAESLGVDAIAAIPPIYFHLPPAAIAQYWNDISDAAPNTDFIIYNIPQLAGVALSVPLLQEMLKNPRVVGVKNSSMPVQDIQLWRDEGAIVFNGPDEQLLSGLAAGAIGGRYAGAVSGGIPLLPGGRSVQRSGSAERVLPHYLQDVYSKGESVCGHQGDSPPSGRTGRRQCPRPPCASGGYGQRCRGRVRRYDSGRCHKILLSA